MNIVCPYCLETIAANDIVRVCNICGDKYTPKFGDGLKLRMGGVLRCAAAGCLGNYSTLQCPQCGAVLPSDIAQYDKYIRFSVVAPSGAGKSNFITTMLQELKKNRKLNFVLAPMNRETSDVHQTNVDSLYHLHRPVAATAPGVVTPMQWRIQDMNRATSKIVPPYSVTIFDGAGEDQENPDPMICRYIAGSKMIMLLLDPTKLAGVREQMTSEEIILAGGKGTPVSHDETAEFIGNIINYLKTACGVPARKKIDIPVAVVFGKMDAVSRCIGDDTLVMTPSNMAVQGAFVQSEADQIHAEIDGWMDACGDNLTNTLNANFTKWRYFGMSSFGVLPEGRTSIKDPVPLRVLDPLIWNFSLEGILPVIR